MKSQTYQFGQILHKEIPFRAWEQAATRRLPGVQPLGDAPWLWRDEVFAHQMAYRDHLISTKPDEVVVEPNAAVFEELRDRVLSELRKDEEYLFEGGVVRRPDGVNIVPGDLASLGRLIQEDMLVHEKQSDEHVLVAGVLCFPANWALRQKLGRSLTGIHDPVPDYDDRVAKGVQRMFDVMAPDRPIWRSNYLAYRTADLHQPYPKEDGDDYLRVERQILTKLPKTDAVIFTIHSFVSAFTAELRHSVTSHSGD
ncbi:MAG: DUF3445 domain-containing protein [Pseudomonadota bacterium]